MHLQLHETNTGGKKFGHLLALIEIACIRKIWWLMPVHALDIVYIMGFGGAIGRLGHRKRQCLCPSSQISFRRRFGSGKARIPIEALRQINRRRRNWCNSISGQAERRKSGRSNSVGSSRLIEMPQESSFPRLWPRGAKCQR